MSTIDRDFVETSAENRAESMEEKVGEAAGGIGGAVLGASVGSAAGPIGTILGGIAGAVGGWWAGEKAGRAVDSMTDDDVDYYRNHYTSVDGTVRDWDDARVGYTLGDAAARNPSYADRSFEDIEADLKLGFDSDDYDWDYAYDDLRPYIREGYLRRRNI